MRSEMSYEKASKILDIKYGASKDEIKKRFRELALAHHPDKGGEAARFIEIREAYAVLMKGEPRSGFATGGAVPHGFHTVYTQRQQGESVTFDFERMATSFRSAFKQVGRLKREMEKQLEDYAELKLGCPVGITISPAGVYMVHINFVALVAAIPLGVDTLLAKAHIDMMSAKQTQYRDVIRNRDSQRTDNANHTG